LIALKAEGARGAVYWFIDQEFYGTQEKNASLLWPVTAGKHTVSLVDERGATAAVRFQVIDILAEQPDILRFSP
jgi:membrane carboxypeptidase/penicillin-binding protein PbpC